MTTSLRAISPLDGRYAAKTTPLRAYLSEWALMKYRLRVEVCWLVALSEHDGIRQLRRFTQAERDLLASLHAGFDDNVAERIKAIEAETSHDVKAVEYFLRERLQRTSLCDVSSWIHFACTSDDINNLAYAMICRDVMRAVWQPAAADLLATMLARSRNWAALPMLARTHGQAATPTTLGKEVAVYVYRLRRQFRGVESQEYLAKFNGAVGAYNAHVVAYPDMNWRDFVEQFIGSLGLDFNPLTTQIEPHDYLAELAHSLIRWNTILLDFCRDMWTYISHGVFRQQVMAREIGSSTMPHKVNPIDFENAEANLGVSNGGLAHLAEKLPISRLQRDLSDSSAMRNYGAAIAHSYLALLSVQRGLAKLEADQVKLAEELEHNWQVLAEAVQTILRKHQVVDAYEQLKVLTRGESVTRDGLQDFIRQLEIPESDKTRLLQLTPSTYVGLAEELALSAE